MPKGVYKRTSYHSEAMRRGNRAIRETLGWLRKCHRCKFETKSEDELPLFVISKQHPHGRYNLCKICGAKAVQARQLKLRAKTNELKNAPCMDCGRQFIPEVMDFDHVRGEKLFDIGAAVSNARPWKIIFAEIKKCDLVCSNCHRIRTHNKRDK